MSRSRVRDDRWAGLVFLAPNVVGFLCFTAGPVLASFLLSFTTWDLLTPPRWVGAGNYVDLLGVHRTAEGWSANDPAFWQYLGNTIFLLLALPCNVLGSLLLAAALSRKLRFGLGYRAILYLPHLVAGVAVYYLWRWMLNPHFGLVNAMLGAIGIDGPNWLGSVIWAKPALMIMTTWTALGGTNLVLYLAAIANVPKELYEAAEIDGAGPWQRFWSVTWPSVRPVTFFIVTIGLIGGLQGGVEAAYVMTGGGPAGATTTLGFYIYRSAYVNFEMGYASAIAWVLFLLVLGVTLLRWRLRGSEP